jgi:hypothetical protein
MSVPPNAPRMRIATAPPRSVSSDPSPPEEARELAARSAIAGTEVRGSDGAAPEAPRRTPCGVLPTADLARPDPPEPGGLIPAPNRAAEPVLALPEVLAPVCLAWFRGSAYSLAAGEPGSTWTPGSKPVAAWAEAARQLRASIARIPTTDMPFAFTTTKIPSLQARHVAIAYPWTDWRPALAMWRHAD